MARSILHISQSDGDAGSARSAYRIHEQLRALGHRSRMLVGERRTDDPDVRPLKRNLAWRAVDRAAAAVTDPLGLQYLLYPSSFGVARDPWFREADVVQLYNTHGSYFSHSALPFLSRRRPVVWRLSDMWAFTGHVAYSLDCERWREGCGSCPYLKDYPALPRDTTHVLWRWKQAVYRRSRLHVVAPSRWLERLASDSPLLSGFPIHRIPNGIDLERFRPFDRREARAALGLDPDRPVVLFLAPDLADRRKGAALLAEALGRLGRLDFQLAVAGANSAPVFPRPVAELGLLSGDDALARAYAAADVFALPTLQDNLPNTALESIACATPVVSFDVGGVGDAVRHLETGWLAPPGDAAGLAAGIETVLSDGELRTRLERTAREVAEREFSAPLEASRFSELYDEILAER